MKWALWQKLPEPAISGLGPKKRYDLNLKKGQKHELQFVHWTKDKECRTINLALHTDGSLDIELFNSDPGGDDLGISVESGSRYFIQGWGE